MFNSLLLFVIYSIPPFLGWWVCFRQPLGRRIFRNAIVVAAPLETVWRRLDPRAPEGGWTPLEETGEREILSNEPLVLASQRRPRQSDRPFARVVETVAIDAQAFRINRAERRGEGARCEFVLTEDGAGTRVALLYEKTITGLLAYELTRLGLARDLDAFQDAVAGRDAKSAPLFRFSGWRLALLGVVSGLVMVALVLAPATYVALGAMGVSFSALLSDPAAFGFVVLFTLASAIYLTALLIFATLVHEMGHAAALAAFGHRGVMVSLVPFGGGVALGARDYANAFEAGVVSLAGPALSALVAFAVLPDPATLSALLQGVAAGAAADNGRALLAFSGALFAFLTLLINIPNVLPWTGSDGALALGAIFSERRLRLVAAGAATALLAFIFAGVDDLLPFGLLFVALTWWNRKRAVTQTPDLPGDWRRLAVAGAFAAIIGLYALEAAALRRVDWTPAPGPEAAAFPDRA